MAQPLRVGQDSAAAAAASEIGVFIGDKLRKV